VSDSEDLQYFTRDQALAIARAEAARSLIDRGHGVSYVTFDATFHDYCLVEFVPEGDGLLKVSRCLTSAERIDGEEILDARIRSLASAGQLVTAIRLYRTKYGVGLAEARDAVSAMT